MGLGNPICGPHRDAEHDDRHAALANVKNVGRYFKTPNPQQMQAMLSAPKQPDPQAMAAQAMMEKVRTETAKAVGQQHIDRTRMEQENAFKHRQLQAKTRSICRSSICRGSRWASTIMSRWRSWRRS